MSAQSVNPPAEPGRDFVRAAAASLSDGWQRARQLLPRGKTLPNREWETRHRAMVWILWAHIIGLTVFLFAQGFGVRGSIGPVLPLVAAGVVADLKGAGRRARSVAVVFGLLTASAVLVYAWHGQIE